MNKKKKKAQYLEHKIPSILEPSLYHLNTKIIIFDRFGYFTLKPFTVDYRCQIICILTPMQVLDYWCQ